MTRRLRSTAFGFGTVLTIAAVTRGAMIDLMLASLVVAGLALAAVGIGLTVHGQGQRAPFWQVWSSLSAGLFLLVCAQLLGLMTGSEGTPAWLALAGPAGQGATMAGFLVLLRARVAGRAFDVLAESLIGALAVVFLLWAFAVDPTAEELVAPALVWSGLATLIGISLVWTGGRTLTLTLNHPPAYRYLVAALLLLLLADAVTAGRLVAGLAAPDEQVAALRLWAFCLWGAGALHPSLRQQFEPVPLRAPRLGFVHLGLVGLGVLAAPVVYVTRSAGGGDLSLPVVLVGSVLLPLVVVAYLVRQVQERASREYRAQHDALTGLPNRVLLHDRLTVALSAARRSGRHVAVLFCDLDRFKTVNDSLGHDAGNDLLQSVAARLTDSLREQDTVARIGGDEFCVLVPDLAVPSQALVVADKVLAAFATPFPAAGRELTAGTSVGIAVSPAHGESPEILLAHADTAMYRAKARGSNRRELYSSGMSARASVRLSMETSLRRTIEQGALELHYQPKVDAASRRVVGLEALVRWPHPRLGFVPPSAFVPLAEESGLILPLGDWVLAAATTQIAQWRREGLPLVPTAINVSARQLASRSVDRDIANALSITGVPPELLEIELTESMFLEDTQRTQQHLRHLAEIGVRTAIDDFGTGFSGLAYLSRMPIDTLKIDRGFVHGMRDARDFALVQAVIALARSLGLSVVAEGVETLEQASTLEGQGVQLMQGFLYSRALPARAVPALLSAGLVPPTAELIAGDADAEVAALLLGVSGGDLDTDLDPVLVERVLRAFDHRSRTEQARIALSRSVSARVAAGSFAGLLPLSGGLAAAEAMPAPIQRVATVALDSLGVDMAPLAAADAGAGSRDAADGRAAGHWSAVAMTGASLADVIRAATQYAGADDRRLPGPPERLHALPEEVVVVAVPVTSRVATGATDVAAPIRAPRVDPAVPQAAPSPRPTQPPVVRSPIDADPVATPDLEDTGGDTSPGKGANDGKGNGKGKGKGTDGKGNAGGSGKGKGGSKGNNNPGGNGNGSGNAPSGPTTPPPGGEGGGTGAPGNDKGQGADHGNAGGNGADRGNGNAGGNGNGPGQGDGPSQGNGNTGDEGSTGEPSPPDTQTPGAGEGGGPGAPGGDKGQGNGNAGGNGNGNGNGAGRDGGGPPSPDDVGGGDAPGSDRGQGAANGSGGG